jgi:5-methylcytosine-specific restriction protein A
MKPTPLPPRIRNVSLSPVPTTDDGERGSTAHLRLRGRALQRRNTRIASRDFYTCQTCRRVTDRAGEGQVDHRIPLAEGGTDDASNLQWLCVDCHRQKTEREKARRA